MRSLHKEKEEHMELQYLHAGYHISTANVKFNYYYLRKNRHVLN